MQGHTYLGDGEGRTCVLLAAAGSFVEEELTPFFAAVQALSHPIPMRLTVRTMATPSGLWSACLCGQHAANAWLVDGGGGLHCELAMLVSNSEALPEVHFGQSILKALYEVKCLLLAVKDSIAVHISLDVISFFQLFSRFELLAISVKA